MSAKTWRPPAADEWSRYRANTPAAARKALAAVAGPDDPARLTVALVADLLFELFPARQIEVLNFVAEAAPELAGLGDLIYQGTRRPAYLTVLGGRYVGLQNVAWAWDMETGEQILDSSDVAEISVTCLWSRLLNLNVLLAPVFDKCTPETTHA